MQSVQFNQRSADEITQELGGEIVRGSKFQAKPWTHIVVVVTLDGEKSMFGYVFWEPTEWQGATPDGLGALRLAADLRESMRVPGSDAWKKCRIRITRATGEIDIDFDYNGNSWTPTMSDPAAFAFSLRDR